MGAERHAITLVVVSLEVFPEQPTVASAVATQQLQTERFVCSRRTAQGRLHITARRLAHHLRPTRLGDPQRRQTQSPFRAQFFQRSEEHTSELQSRQYLVCR